MNFDPHETVILNGSVNKVEDSAAVPFGVHERKSIESIRPAIHDRRYLAVRMRVVRVEGREQHGALDSSRCGPAKVLLERRSRVPGTGQPIARSGMTMTVDDERVGLSRQWFAPPATYASPR